MPTGELLWFKHLGQQEGTADWVGSHGKQVGTGWEGFRLAFAGPDGVIYGLADGQLLWFKHLGQQEGTADWVGSHGKLVGTGWEGFRLAFAGPDGVIYGVD